MSTLNVDNSTDPYSAKFVARNTFLCLCMSFSLFGNLSIVVVITTSRVLRRKAVYRLLISCIVSNLLDVFLNLPVVLAASFSKVWFDLEFVCPMNAFVVQVVDSSILLNLLLMSIERAFAVHSSESRKISCNISGQAFSIGIIWIVSIVMAIPVTVVNNGNSVIAKLYNARYSCSTGRLTPLVYSTILFIVTFFIPFLTSMIIYFTILRVGLRERQRRQELECQQDYARGNVPKPAIWVELNMSKFTGILLVGWIIFVGPYKILLVIDGIINSKELSNPKNPRYSISATAETTLLWLRHYYSLWLPLLSICLKRKIRRKCRCQRNQEEHIGNGHAVQVVTPVINNRLRRSPPNSDNQLGNRNSSSSDDDDELSLTPRNGAVQNTIQGFPVLYATSQGLHIHTEADNRYENASTLPIREYTSSSMKTILPVKCDVDNSTTDIVSSCADEDLQSEHNLTVSK